MMATESPQDRSNEATVTSDSDRAPKIDPASQNVDPDRPQINREAGSTPTDEIGNKAISDIVDDLVNSAEVSVSGGSDTEASRSRLKEGEKGHGRTSSTVKKPTSFKSVSVNKTFLASKGAAATGPSKTIEKPAPGASLTSAPGAASATTSRPRLVAKSGSGLIAKSSSGLNGGKSAAAPDPNAVWNKNRPVPPPEPKKFTDEELKKYGIHMATRLHPDDGKGQSNWADIDDDDDDWAPDAISWKDGTKIAIPQVDESSSQASAATQQASKDVMGMQKPRSPAPLSGPARAVSPVKSSVLGSGKGLVLKGAPEKPTLVAKPPAPPAPVKSPWAPIPRVEKASPVADTLPPQPGPGKFAGKDGLGPKSMTPPPPKEIAADDFNRAAWRDSHPSGNRELFNSQSGRYEPVMDRRASIRSDQHSRQPALLQRNTHPDHQGPAEPSPAFQTSRVSEQQPHGSYGRRRGSSNVSGGSGSFLRLKGQEQSSAPPDVLPARRESFTASSENPVSPRIFPSALQQSGPRHPHNQAWPPHGPPAAAHPVQHPAGASVDSKAVPTVTDQDIEEQKRLMHEKRELAKQRRLEQEAREEAAKRERIRLKLEAMGPAPESRSARMAAAKQEAPTIAQKQPEKQPGQPGQPSPPVDDSNRPEAAGNIVRPRGKPETTADGIPAHGPSRTPPVPRDTGDSRAQSQGSNQAHPWANTASVPSDRYPSWGIQNPAKNVWASPNNDRSLGNGTFIADLGRGPEHPQIPSVPGKAGPGPIAPPNAGRGTRQPPIGPPTHSSRAEDESRQRSAVHNAWTTKIRESDAALESELQAKHEEDMRRLEAEGHTLSDLQPAIRDTWRPTKLSEDGRRTQDGPKQIFNHPRGVAWVTTSVEGQQPPSDMNQSGATSNRRAQGGIVPGDAQPATILATVSGAAPQQGRGSRFFPARDVRQEAAEAAGHDSKRHSSPSPPPPDMAGHPAFDGDVARPHVSLPRPQPVVRLPPAPGAAAGHSSSANQAPNFAWATPSAYREHEIGQPISPNTQNAPRGPMHAPENKWQARIDSLLGGRKGPSPPKSLPVDSASRSSLEHQRHHNAATISLPSPRPAVLATGSDGSVTSKGMAEECFEEQEMGSLPPIRLPNKVPDTAWQLCPAPKPLPRKLFATVLSIEPLTFPNDMSGGGTVLRIFIPGMGETKNITIPFSRTRSNPRRSGRSGRHASQPHRPGKGRETSSTYPSEHQGASTHGQAQRGNGRTGGYRGRDNWSRNASNPIQT